VSELTRQDLKVLDILAGEEVGRTWNEWEEFTNEPDKIKRAKLKRAVVLSRQETERYLRKVETKVTIEAGKIRKKLKKKHSAVNK